MLKGAATRLVDDLLAIEGIQLGDDIVAWFSSNEQPAQGSCVADAETRRILFAAG